jgi:hypothetical protein
VAADESLVLSILMVRIDAEGSLLDQGAHQVEAGILIPSAARVKICIRNESDSGDEQNALWDERGTGWRRRGRIVLFVFGVQLPETSKIIWRTPAVKL